MKKHIIITLAFILAFTACACGKPSSTAVPTATPTVTATPTTAPTAEPTAEPTPEPTDSPSPTPGVITAKYLHDPTLYEKAMEDIIIDPTAIYGFSPNPESARLGAYASYDWSDLAVVESGRKDRIAYHQSIQSMYAMLDDMMYKGCNVEEIARAISAERNRIRLASYENDPEGLEKLKKSNLEKYGDENGPSADSLFEKYGAWETVLEKAFSPNIGMDVCLGIYDDYYNTYLSLGIIDNVIDTIVAANEYSAIAERNEAVKYTHTVTNYDGSPIISAFAYKDPNKFLLNNSTIGTCLICINNSLYNYYTEEDLSVYYCNVSSDSDGYLDERLDFLADMADTDDDTIYSEQLADGNLLVTTECTDADKIGYFISKYSLDFAGAEAMYTHICADPTTYEVISLSMELSRSGEVFTFYRIERELSPEAEEVPETVASLIASESCRNVTFIADPDTEYEAVYKFSVPVGMTASPLLAEQYEAVLYTDRACTIPHDNSVSSEDVTFYLKSKQAE